MAPNQIIQLGEQRSAILISGKLFNDDNGLIWPTKGRFSAFSGLRYVPLVAGQARAGNMPRQQTRKTCQLTPYWLKVLKG